MATYYIGWDVGTWDCKGSSSDAIVVIDDTGKEVISLRKIVKFEPSVKQICSFLNMYFNFEKDRFFPEDTFYFAIDAVFSLPDGVQCLLSNESVTIPNKFKENQFLFRKTEQFIMEKIIEKNDKCLSVIHDRIGNQATKIMFFLRYFGFQQKEKEAGVWKSDNNNAIAIEVYPKLTVEYAPEKKSDEYDAEKCAELAYTFANYNTQLYSPQNYIEEFEKSDKEEQCIKKEGWIWFPKSKFKK